jgi:acyl-CoA synthetase (AMP-forming)/AMP-acid ligase II/3-hydroxymyristoyl/3-hydroxydecanoyl-(acyl carrier protein) dehydratase
MRMAEWIALDRLALVPQPGRIVGIDADGQAVPHPQFRARVQGWQQAFARAPGRDWALYFDDTLDFAAALLGAWHAGKRVFLGGDNLPATLEGLAPRVAGFAGDVPSRYAPLQPDPTPDASAPLLALDEDALELVVFTSGSTGAPTAIGKYLRQLTREVDALQAAFGEQLEGAQIHGTVSHQHIYGLLFRVLWPLVAGRAILPRRFFHEDLISALAQQDSVLVATPAHLKRLPEQLDWPSLGGRLRAVFSSGGPLPTEAALQARALLGVAPTEVFGSSETGGIAWRQWSAEQPQWHPLPGVSWRIDDGCLSVSSPHLAEAGWWQTQDRVEADAGRSFRLLGRADRIVKIEERRVSLDALEQQLCAHPSVQEARVLVLPGAREQLAAVVVPRVAGVAQWDDAERRRQAQALGAHLAQSQDAVTRPRRWRFVDALPFNAQGKTTAAALGALFRPLLPAGEWQQRDAAAAVLVLPLEPDLVAFDGHFPQAKILPGVVQLDWAIHYGRQAFTLPPRFERMDALKFQHVARPGDRLQLTLGWDAAKSVLSFRYVSDHGVHASGRVVFGDA